MKVSRKLLFFIFTVFFGIFSTFQSKSVEIVNQRCEFQVKPIGLSESHPRFTWELKSSLSNVVSESFQIKVATSPDLLSSPDVWASDIIQSTDNAIKYPSGNDSKVKKLEPLKRYYWNLSVWVSVGGKKQKIDSKVSSFETGMFDENDWSAKWITDKHDMEYEPAPLFRKIIKTKNKKIKEARAHVAGLGYHEMYINSKKVSDYLHVPAFTDYNKRALYISYDITKHLQNDKENAVAVILGNGGFNEQRMSNWGSTFATWRRRPKMMCEIHIAYEDGSKEIVISDETWKTSTESPFIFNNLYVGDYYDNRVNNTAWKAVSFNDSNWEKASLTTSPSPILEKFQMPPVRVHRQIKPVSMKKFSSNLYVYDMGENFSGFCKIKVKGKKGTKVRMLFGELLDDDGKVNQKNIDLYYSPTEEHPTMTTDMFILNGDGKYEEFQPTFTYRGFQYVQIESDNPIELKKNNLQGYFIYNDLTPVGNFSCSDTTLNKIWKAANQSYLSNWHNIPTDCPSREKNGWTADVWLAINMGLLNFDGVLAYEKWMKDLVDSQIETGQIPGIIPVSGYTRPKSGEKVAYQERIGPAWDAAMFIVPYKVYCHYGDISIIENTYETMVKYLEFLDTRDKNGLLTYGLSDRNQWHTETPPRYTSTLFYYIDNLLMIKFSKLLNKDASKYEKKLEEIKRAIKNHLYKPDRYIYSNGSQTAQAMALYLGIAPKEDEAKILDVLVKNVEKNGNRIDFGLFGAVTVPRVLTKHGYGDMVYNMVVKPTPPSWGYWVNTLNSKTLLENWVQNFTRSSHGGSLNHIFYGDISAWMTNCLAGINYDAANPGFKNVIIQPHFINSLDWVYGEYKSVRGLIVSKWERRNNNIVFEVQIPANTTATIIINGKEHKVGSGKHKYTIRK